MGNHSVKKWKNYFLIYLKVLNVQLKSTHSWNLKKKMTLIDKEECRSNNSEPNLKINRKRSRLLLDKKEPNKENILKMKSKQERHVKKTTIIL